MVLCCFTFGKPKPPKRPPARSQTSSAEAKVKEATVVEVQELPRADISEVQGQTPAPTPASAGWRDVKNTALNALVAALKITKEATPIFPPLQSAAGGILAIVEVFQKMSANRDDIEMLTRYLEKLGEFYKTLNTAFPGEYKRVCPEALRKRLEDFDREVQGIAQDLRRLSSQALPAQVLNAEDTADEIDGYAKRLSMLVNNLVVGGTISIELAVDELQIVIVQGFEHMDDRFDGLSGQIDGLGTQINQLVNDSGTGLRYTIQARFDFHKNGRSICDTNTRREALATVYAWLRPDDPRLSEYPPPLFSVRPEHPIFWINGLAGTGKSTLAQTVAHWCEDVGFLGATFFCARDGERSNVLLIVPTIAHQLGSFCPAFRDEVSKAAKANPDIHGSLVSRQLQKLLVEPLQAVKRNGVFPACAIIIDALDECKDDDVVSVVLKALSGSVSSLEPLKFLITSRPIQRVTDGFGLQELVDNTQQFSLNTIPVEATKRDIADFLRTRLADIKKRYYVGGYWPTDKEIDDLVALASELFIFAATAVQFVGDRRANDPESQLVFLLHPPALSSVATARDSPYKHLDALYLQVLTSAFPKVDRRVRAEMKNIIGTIALIQEQLHPGTLEALLQLKGGLVRRTLRDVHSIIVVPPTDEEVIRVIHRSFADFIVDRDRCTNGDFLVNPSVQHTVIANRCLQAMFFLRRDICQVRNETLLNSEVPDLNARVARHVPPHVLYACKYWAYHLCRAGIEQEVIGNLEKFCRGYLLFWLEALSLLGSVDIAIEALRSARDALQELPLPPADTTTILYDCERVVRFFYPAISASCFQVYRCALPFSPSSSLLRTLYYASQARDTIKILCGQQKDWSPNTMSVEAHSGRVQCVVFSPNGERIASCSEDATIRLWDARTGAQLHVLEGHAARVCSIAFSPTGKEILSGSDDLTVKIWDATTGAILGSWNRHERDVRSVAWSPDGKYVASGSYDTTVILWPVSDPYDTTLFTEHTDEVDSIVFDSEGDLLSSSHDGTCKIWNVDSRSCKRTFTYPSPIMSVAASRDSRIVACGCRDANIVLWNKADGTQLHVLNQHASWVWSIDFSPDNRTLASGSWDHTLCLWDVASGKHLETLLGHADQVLSVRFSPDGKHIVTGECDHSVRIWECGSEILEREKPKKKAARKSSSTAVEKRTWDAFTGTYSSTGDHHASPVRVVSFAPNGKILATAAWDGTIRLWDVLTGTRLKTLVGHKHLITSVAWSSSGRWLTSTGDQDGTVRVWDAQTGKCVETFREHIGGVWVSLFMHDESKVISSSDDGSIRLWNVRSGKPGAVSEVLFQGTGPIYALALSHDSRWLLSGSLDASPPEPGGSTVGPTQKPVRVAGKIRGVWEETYGYPTVRLHDTSGHVLWMENHISTVASLAFSQDGTRALSGSQEGEFFLYDLTGILPVNGASPASSKSAGGINIGMFQVGDDNPVEHIAFSADDRAIITDASYTPLESKLWPESAHRAALTTFAVYFLLDGWLWRAAPELRRICWIPPTFRHFRNGATAWRGNMAIRGHIVALGTNHGQLVILDASGC